MGRRYIRDKRGPFAGGGGSAPGRLKGGENVSRLVVGGSPRGTVAGTRAGRQANDQRRLATSVAAPRRGPTTQAIRGPANRPAVMTVSGRQQQITAAKKHLGVNATPHEVAVMRYQRQQRNAPENYDQAVARRAREVKAGTYRPPTDSPGPAASRPYNPIEGKPMMQQAYERSRIPADVLAEDRARDLGWKPTRQQGRR